MDASWPSDYREVIDAEKDHSLAVLFTSENYCIEGSENLAVPGRRFRVPGGDAFAFEPPERCVVVVVLCPGDELDEFVDWVARHGIEPAERVLLVYHPECQMHAILEPWYEHFDADPIAYEMEAYPGKRTEREWTVAQKVGQWYNDWIYLDAKGWEWPLSGP